MAPMRILLVGNFQTPAQTEVHLSAALREWGEQVTEVQLSSATVKTLPRRFRNQRFDILLWVHTSHLCPDNGLVARAINEAKSAGIFTAAFHLDRYWDLKRETAITTEPWFQADLVMSADGGRNNQWADAGINHMWVPPACHGADAELIGVPDEKYRAQVAFVGSWSRYHSEWPWRMEMIALLRQRYGDSFRTFPEDGKRIYGQELANLYASVDVIVGDSIFAGTDKGANYVSDRPYLTLGHRGVLAMPRNHPLEESFTDGTHLLYFDAQHPPSMFEAIDNLLDSPDLRTRLREQGHTEILANHLYRHRVREMLSWMTERRLSTLGWPGEARPNTHDATAIRETWLEDVYHGKDYIKPGDRVVDCGANVGAFAIFAARLGAHVTAVEPVPNNLAQLRRNIALAGEQSAIDIIESAVGEKEGTISLGFFDTDGSQSAFRSPDGSGEITVPVRTLASIIGEQPVDFLKMDIEGSERWALPGAPLHLVNHIAIETHNTLDPGTTHQRVKGWLAPTHEILHESGGHSEGYVIARRRA